MAGIEIKDIVELFVYATLLGFVTWLKDRKKKDGGLIHTTERLVKCKAILNEIMHELEADRVQLWDGSNGTTSLSGYHIQKLTVFAEANKEGLPDIAHKFENIPSQKMQRNLLRLADSDDGFIISYEKLEHDDIARMNQAHGIHTALLVRIESAKKGWVGILLVGWSSDRVASNYEVSFAKMKASQLGTIDRL